MYFAQYIQALYRCIKTSMTQPEFTEEFLKNAVEDGKEPQYSVSSYKNFFAGKTVGTGVHKKIVGDHICGYALKICKHIKKDKLQKYLEKFMRSEIIEQACMEFKEHIPDINAGNCIEKLADLFERIINEAAVGKSESSKDKSVLIEKDTNAIDDILKELKSKYEKLKTHVIDLQIVYDYIPLDERTIAENGVLSYYHDFVCLNAELEMFCQRYPKCSHLTLLYKIGERLTFKDFLYWKNRVTSRSYSEDVEKYSAQLDICLRLVVHPDFLQPNAP